MKRHRLTKAQHLFLRAAYDKNPSWDVDMLKQLAMQVGCSKIVVFKWHYDTWHREAAINNAAKNKF